MPGSTITIGQKTTGGLGLDWRPSASSSRAHFSDEYELSDELRRHREEVLERRYGGPQRAHEAANVIQRAFRRNQLERTWQQQLADRPSAADSKSTRQQQQQQQQQQTLPQHSSPHQQTHAPSLRAQLRLASTSTLSSTSGLTAAESSPLFRGRSPPSPSPAGRQSTVAPPKTGFCTGGGGLSAVAVAPHSIPIDSLMSPRLVQRRVLAAAGIECAVSTLGRPTVHSTSSSSTSRLDRISIPPPPPPHSATRPSGHGLRPLSETDRKRQYRIALNFFNRKPERGIALLVRWGFVEERADAIAAFLLSRRGLSRQAIGDYLGTLHSVFHKHVLESLLATVDVRELPIDEALRHVLSFFRLPGEAQKIEHIMQTFSRHYARSNPHVLHSFHDGADTVFIIAFAVIMLNTDLHSPSLRAAQRMKKADFVKNLRGCDKGHDIDSDLLAPIFDRISTAELRAGADHVTQVARVDMAVVGKDKPQRLVEPQRRLVCYCRLHEVADINRRQSSSAHQRECFLFNDGLLVTKLQSTNGSSGAATYSFRFWLPLLGMQVEQLRAGIYEHAIRLLLPDRREWLFNARNADDRMRFCADVRESVTECNEMETIRIELELDKHLAPAIVKASALSTSALPRPAYSDGSDTSSHMDTQRSHMQVCKASKAVDMVLEEADELEDARADAQRDSGLPEEMQQPAVVDAANGAVVAMVGQPPGGGGGGGVAAPLHPVVHRLSHNSLDSGVVEESLELATAT